MSTAIDQHISDSLGYIRKDIDNKPTKAVILGSGLGHFADSLNQPQAIKTADIPHIPGSTVSGHSGRLVFGRIGNTSVVCVQGRTHYYEGYPIAQTTYIVRLLKALGVQQLLLTNAAGALHRRLSPGDLMLIDDIANLMFANPLRGKLWAGDQRFPDLHNVPSREMNRRIQLIAIEQKILLKQGVLIATHGPCYETAAEVQMFARLGGDAISMSTIPEFLTAAAIGLPAAGISSITNWGTGISPHPLSHREVTEVAKKSEQRFQKLLNSILVEL